MIPKCKLTGLPCDGDNSICAITKNFWKPYQIKDGVYEKKTYANFRCLNYQVVPDPTECDGYQQGACASCEALDRRR